jgi:hypothetical protein
VGKTSYSAHGGNIPNQWQPEVPAYSPKKFVATTSLSSTRLAVKLNLNALRLNLEKRTVISAVEELICSSEETTLENKKPRLAPCGASASAFIYVFIYVSAPQSNVLECANRGAHRGTSQ